LTPSNEIVRPNCPAVLRVAPLMVPVRPFPDESRTDAPVVSSNP